MLFKDYKTVICRVRNLMCCVKLDNMCIAMYFSDVAPSDVWVVVTKGTKERSLIYLERSDFNKLFTQ